MPAKKRKQPDEKYPLKLTAKQRESLVHATRLAMGLKTRIKEASKDQQFIEFTKKELEKLGDEIDSSLDLCPTRSQETAERCPQQDRRSPGRPRGGST